MEHASTGSNSLIVLNELTGSLLAERPRYREIVWSAWIDTDGRNAGALISHRSS